MRFKHQNIIGSVNEVVKFIRFNANRVVISETEPRLGFRNNFVGRLYDKALRTYVSL